MIDAVRLQTRVSASVKNDEVGSTSGGQKQIIAIAGSAAFELTQDVAIRDRNALFICSVRI